jgi:hypothetical protein
MSGPTLQSDFPRKALSALGITLGWIWTAIAGGGGLLMLIREGPWPLTNGWFALASGLCACPATAFALRRYVGLTPGWALPAAAATCFIAGRIALVLGHGSNG